ncbi:hypothetical protein A0J51_03171 [Gluconobacter japonicus]|nr:hypothetical protein A0J51_03171 [Gluconobacter japonicus]
MNTLTSETYLFMAGRPCPENQQDGSGAAPMPSMEVKCPAFVIGEMAEMAAAKEGSFGLL